MHGRSVAIGHCSLLKNFPKKIRSPANLQKLITTVHMLRTCAGNPDEQYLPVVDQRKGMVRRETEESAFIDDFSPVEINGEVFLRTVRYAECEYLVRDARCDSCKSYRANLRALSSRHKQQALSTPTKRTSISSHVNFRYLNTPEKAKRLANTS